MSDAVTSTRAAFFAFKKRERGGVLTQATIGYLIVLFVLIAALAAVAWRGLSAYFEWAATMTPGDAEAMTPPPEVMQALPVFLLFMPLFYLATAAYEAACLRWLVGGEAGGGFLGLKLDADVWRVFVCYLVWVALFIGGVFGLAILVGIASAVNMMLAVALGFIGFFALIFFAIRLAPAAAVTVGIGKFSFFKAWTATQGKFWTLFGAFFFIFIMLIVASVVLAIVFFAVVGGAMGAGAGGGDPEAMAEAMRNPTAAVGMGIYYVGSLLISMIFYIAMFGANSAVAIAAHEEGKV